MSQIRPLWVVLYDTMELYAESDSYNLHLNVFQTSIGLGDNLHTFTSDFRAWWHVIFKC